MMALYQLRESLCGARQYYVQLSRGGQESPFRPEGRWQIMNTHSLFPLLDSAVSGYRVWPRCFHNGATL